MAARWMHQTYSMWGDDNKIFEYMDGHALLYDGQVTITKVEGEGKENWYRFEVDGICVRKHHVRGTWEGPVVSQTGRAAAEKDHLEPAQTASPPAGSVGSDEPSGRRTAGHHVPQGRNDRMTTEKPG